MKLFALILALALLFTAAQAATDLKVCDPKNKDGDCGNVVPNTDPLYDCCARLKGTYNDEPVDGHYCMFLAYMKNIEKTHEKIGLETAYCDSASYITAAFATLFVSIFTFSF